MKIKWIQVIILAILTSFSTMMFSPAQVIAVPSQVVVIIKVNEDGFFGVDGKLFNNVIKVPRERTIKLIFEHVGNPGEKHAFVLLFDTDEEIESGIISDLNKRTHIEFNTGKEGEIYDVFCVIVECDGMEHMTDLIIMVI